MGPSGNTCELRLKHAGTGKVSWKVFWGMMLTAARWCPLSGRGKCAGSTRTKPRVMAVGNYDPATPPCHQDPMTATFDGGAEMWPFKSLDRSETLIEVIAM